MASMTSSQDIIMNKIKGEHTQMKLMMAQNTKLMSMLVSNITRKKEETARRSRETEKEKNRSAFANTARNPDITRMRIVVHCLRTKISAQHGTMNRVVWGLGVVTWR